MKKLMSLFLSLMLGLSLTACSASQSKSEVSTFSAAAKGYGGEVTVTLTIDGEYLKNVEIAGEQETESVGGQAIEQMPAKMLEHNSVHVDGVTGATYTSDAILSAAAEALAKSGVELKENEFTQKETVQNEDVYADVLVLGGGSSRIERSRNRQGKWRG